MSNFEYKRFWKSLDKNGDNSLTFKEFCKIVSPGNAMPDAKVRRACASGRLWVAVCSVVIALPRALGTHRAPCHAPWSRCFGQYVVVIVFYHLCGVVRKRVRV